MELVGADPDLRPETKLAPIIEPGAGIDNHGGAIDFLDESPGRVDPVRDDGVSMFRAVAGNVGQGGIEIFDDPNGDDQVEILGVPILRRSWLRRRNHRERGVVTANLDLVFGQGFSQDR